MFLRQAARLVSHIGHDVVACHDEDALKAGVLDLCSDVLGDACVDADQFQAGLSGLLCGSGGDHDDVCVAAFFIFAGLDGHLGIGIRQTVAEIHLFADSLVFVHVDEYQFVDALLREQRISKAHSDETGTDQNDFSLSDSFFHN